MTSGFDTLHAAIRLVREGKLTEQEQEEVLREMNYILGAIHHSYAHLLEDDNIMFKGQHDRLRTIRYILRKYDSY